MSSNNVRTNFLQNIYPYILNDFYLFKNIKPIREVKKRTLSDLKSSICMRNGYKCYNRPNVFKVPSKNLSDLLRYNLTRRVVRGKPFLTLKFHRRQLIKELEEKLGCLLKERKEPTRTRFFSFGDVASKKISVESLEWRKHLTQWLKANTSGAVLSNREVYKTLAVDGFRGFKPKHLKSYFSAVARNAFHAKGVRRMYDFFEEKEEVCSLNGTDSACVVFLALMNWYLNQMRGDPMLDDQIMIQVQRVKEETYENLQQHVEYYPKLKNVNEDLLKEFGRVYEEQIGNESWRDVGRQLLMML